MSDFFEKLPKVMLAGSLATVVLGGAFAYGVLAQRNDLVPLPQIKSAFALLSEPRQNDLTRHPRHEHLQPSRGAGEGVTVNTLPDDGAQILMAGFFDDENQIRLVGRDGEVVRKWSLDFFEHFPDPGTRACDVTSPLRADTHGVHLSPQGELVFNYEYCGTVKLDACGTVLWTVNKPTHHSLVPAAAGGYWSLGRHKWLASEYPDRFPPISSAGTDQEILEDTLLRIGEDGEVLEEVSIPQLMLDNDLDGVLTANLGFGMKSIMRPELVHANKVTELSADIADAFPLFSAGDLAISMRQLNLIMVLDPETKAVKWHQTGPWVRQHDPEFRPDGRLSIFNNNVYRTAYVDGQTDLSAPRTTNIIAVDPVSRETEVIFGERPGQEMLSVIRGQHELLDNGRMLITEFDAGRVIEVDTDGQIVWEYINAFDEDFVGEIRDAKVYPADYFGEALPECQG